MPIPTVQPKPSTAPTSDLPIPQRWRHWASWWSKLVALIALVNLGLGLFNLSYISLRDTYLQELPMLVSLYDPVKGIEPHPDTQHYLQRVDDLSRQLQQTGLESPQGTQHLQELRQHSTALIDENPFLDSNKFAAFAKLKRRMRERVGVESATAAFSQFWSQDYLQRAGWQDELAFFNQQMRPLLAANYFRAVAETGQFVDRFWWLDLYFIAFFAVDFLGRTLSLSRRHTGLSWGDAMLRRWYDALLLLPTWRWLRIIPVGVRLHQSQLVNMERWLSQITHEPAAYLADRVSQFLMVRLVNQTQDSIRQGEAVRVLLQSGDYIRVNDTDKVDAIADRLLQITIYSVLPQVQPELKLLLRHSLRQFDFYQQLQDIPAIGALPINVTDQVADYLAQITSEALAASYADQQGRDLFDNFTSQIKRSLRQELENQATQQELQTLLVDLLEELKLNYVQRAAQDNPEATLAEADRLHELAGKPAAAHPTDTDGEKPGWLKADSTPSTKNNRIES